MRSEVDHLAKNRYVLKNTTFKRLQKRSSNRPLVCFHCGKPLELEQEILVISRSAGWTKAYHGSCFDGLFIGDEENPEYSDRQSE